ncbi:MAG: hypothetical protein AAB546_01765 [Patescibacteria group bacterium]
MEPNRPNQQSTNNQLQLTVRDRTTTLFNGEIKNLSSVNEKGKFDILGEHANFISIVKEKLIVRLLDGKQQEIPIDQGVLKVRENKIVIFLGIKT